MGPFGLKFMADEARGVTRGDVVSIISSTASPRDSVARGRIPMVSMMFAGRAGGTSQHLNMNSSLLADRHGRCWLRELLAENGSQRLKPRFPFVPLTRAESALFHVTLATIPRVKNTAPLDIKNVMICL